MEQNLFFTKLIEKTHFLFDQMAQAQTPEEKKKLRDEARQTIDGLARQGAGSDREAVQDGEARFYAIFNQSADAIMTAAPPDWRFTGCNPAALKLFEVSDEVAFTQLGPWDLSPEFQPNQQRSDEVAAKWIAEAMAKGSCLFDWVHKTRTGKNFECSVLLSRIDIKGKSYLQATVRDVSRERSILAELEARTDELSVIVSISPFGIARLDSNFNFLSSNAAFESFLGYASTEMKGRSILEIVHPDDQSMTQTTFESFPKMSNLLSRFQMRCIHKNGKVAWGLVTI